MKLTKTLRMFGIAAALLGTLATKSFALPANEVEIDYFSDAQFTKDVGSFTLLCEGGHITEGKRSRYGIRYSTPCRSPWPIEVNCYVDSVLTTCPASICDSGLYDCQ